MVEHLEPISMSNEILEQAHGLAAGSAPFIPVLRPHLPESGDLLPYLLRIDAGRVYANWGPLATEFERRLCDHLGAPSGGFVSASSGTAALVGATLATAGRATEERPLALVPAFTFIATAVAVELCGYEVYLADVDAATWMLDLERLGEEVALERVGLVMPVAPFGRPVPQAPWLEFRARTGIPIVIDGAASFEGVSAIPEDSLGGIPVAMSFHATKSFSTGEGGGVVCRDVELAQRVAQALNFGFHGVRDSAMASTNGKLSEYHAAVGLAELDGWEQKSSALRRVADAYKRVLAKAGLFDRLTVAPKICSSYVLFGCESDRQALRVCDVLGRHGVDYRIWYGRGLQHQTHLFESGRNSLEVTEKIAPRIIGLPIALDLPERSIERVAAALVDGLSMP
jgi:dTDP-4-amino-4,6-dideoxygalactose transaminase